MASPTPSPKLMEKAREILYGPLPEGKGGHIKLYLLKDRDIPKQAIENVIQAVALALQQHGDEQRDIALEEAALKAESFIKPEYKEKGKSDSWAYGCNTACKDVAYAIRSLKRTP